VRAFVKKFGQRLFLGTAHVHGFTIHDLRDVRSLIVQVADQDRLSRANHYARRFQSDINPVRAEITFLGGMIFGIDKDCVVRARGHAGFAADADRLVEIDDAVRAFEHRRSRTRRHAGRVRALVAARDLMRAPHLRKHADIDVFDISARHADGHDVLRLARRRARMTADAAGVVDDLGPLHPVSASYLWLGHFDFE
jgi:hypothetical protein